MFTLRRQRWVYVLHVCVDHCGSGGRSHHLLRKHRHGRGVSLTQGAAHYPSAAIVGTSRTTAVATTTPTTTATTTTLCSA